MDICLFLQFQIFEGCCHNSDSNASEPASLSEKAALLPTEELDEDAAGKSKSWLAACCTGLLTITAAVSLTGGSGTNAAISHQVMLRPSRTLFAVSSSTPRVCDASTASEDAQFWGYLIGWASGIIYLSSRVPQILKNRQRKSVEGLSPLLFFCAVMGNATYATSILLNLNEFAEISKYLPWLVGSVGTLAFDFTILMQFFYYTEPTRKHLGGNSRDQDIPRGIHNIVDWNTTPVLNQQQRAHERYMQALQEGTV